jgi:hypothetical protein
VRKVVGVAAIVVLAAMAAACNKPQQPKTDPATERAAAHDRASKDAFSAQVKGVDKAQALGADMNAKAESRLEEADKMSK